MYAGFSSCRSAWVAFAAADSACLLNGSAVEGAEDGSVYKCYITWKKSPKKCINLVGGKRNNGNVAELADCKDIDTMQFVVPASGKGLIKLLGTEKEDKSLCLDAPDDAQLMRWDCEKGSADNKMFLMPKDGVGKIQLASDANKCITVTFIIAMAHQQLRSFALVLLAVCAYAFWAALSFVGSFSSKHGATTGLQAIVLAQGMLILGQLLQVDPEDTVESTSSLRFCGALVSMLAALVVGSVVGSAFGSAMGGGNGGSSTSTDRMLENQQRQDEGQLDRLVSEFEDLKSDMMEFKVAMP